jgi:tetratricopeptide (TPR) repeat protein
MKHSQITLVVACNVLFFAQWATAQRPEAPIKPGEEAPGVVAPGLDLGGQHVGEVRVCGYGENQVCAAVEVRVKGEDGQAVDGPVSVSLIKENGQVFMTALAEKGKVRFGDVPKSTLTVRVVAPGFQTTEKRFEVLNRANVQVKINLQPMTDREMAASAKGFAALSPKAQKDVGKALEELRANRPAEARNHLELAAREAPQSAEVQYLFGVYASQLNNEALARSYWMKALNLNPTHLNALLAVGQSLLLELKADEAILYLRRALDVEPSSWRVHMLMAQADLLQGNNSGAVKHAERAMELGHEQAMPVYPLMAEALYESGEKERAMLLLKDYVVAHPGDLNAAELLKKMTYSAVAGTSAETPELIKAAGAATLPSNWLPADVDEKTPQVDPDAVCVLDDVVQKAGYQIQQLVRDLDRFTATEFVTHESVDKYGIASPPEKHKFDYLVSIQDVRPGHLNVTEYRDGGEAQDEFPDGIATYGLPALVLIFHPYYAPNYAMTCEGLSRVKGILAWQVHFRQRSDKPNELKTYQIGLHGTPYSVGLKGRAWISADSYQIIRMETDIVGPAPQIKLLAEHTAIEYGPVTFRHGSETLWLPESVELYFAWRGRQAHRWHTFQNYMLFAVDDNQRIAAPKNVEPSSHPDALRQTKPSS